jgi:hypothetical protein
MKSLKEMLEICEKATPGPWQLEEYKGMFRVYAGEKSLRIVSGIIDSYSSEDERNNGNYIAESREGWPYTIKRLIVAERLLQYVWEALDNGNPEIVTEIDEEIKEFLNREESNCEPSTNVPKVNQSTE